MLNKCSLIRKYTEEKNIMKYVIFTGWEGSFFLKFYFSAKLPINSTYNVDEKFGTEEGRFFARTFIKIINITKTKRVKGYCEHFFKEKIGVIVLITNE